MGKTMELDESFDFGFSIVDEQELDVLQEAEEKLTVVSGNADALEERLNKLVIMQDQTQVPVPTALKELILSNNLLLQQYQEQLTSKVIVANIEMMQLLGLNPTDGWKLDTDTMMYIKQEHDTSIG